MVFSCFGGQNFFFNLKKYFSNRIEELHKIAFTVFFLLLKKIEKVVFFRANTQILKSECTT